MNSEAVPSEPDGPTDDEVARLLMGGWKGRPHTRHLDPASWDALVELYGRGASMRSLAQRFGIPEEAVASELRRRSIPIRPRGLARRKRTLREDAFDTITEESAYWIGFLMANGYVRIAGNARIVGVCVRPGDAGHLERLRAFLGSDHAIVRRKASAELRVSSARLAESLATHGVLPGKSETARVRGLERDRHFWRGVVDGKGHLDVVHGGPTLSLRGPRGLVGQFASYVRSVIAGRRVSAQPVGTVYRCSLGGEAALIMMRLLYDGCSIALDRNQALARSVIDNAR